MILNPCHFQLSVTHTVYLPISMYIVYGAKIKCHVLLSSLIHAKLHIGTVNIGQIQKCFIDQNRSETSLRRVSWYGFLLVKGIQWQTTPRFSIKVQDTYFNKTIWMWRQFAHIAIKIGSRFKICFSQKLKKDLGRALLNVRCTKLILLSLMIIGAITKGRYQIESARRISGMTFTKHTQSQRLES